MLITTHGKYISDNQSIKPRRNYMWIVTALETWDCKSNNILKANSKTEQRYRADNTTYDLLEKLTELRRATIHIVIVCYSEKKKIQIKISRGRRYIQQCLRDFRHALPPVLSQWSQKDMLTSLPEMMCGNPYGVLSAREIHLSTGVQGLYWRLSHRHQWPPTHLS